MSALSLRVDETEGGQRLDVFVVTSIELEVSRSYIQKLIEDGSITVNGEVKPTKYKVSATDTVTVNIPEPKSFSNEILPVLYEDTNVIVINKPAGILTHAKGAPLDEFTVAEFMRNRTTDKPESNRPGIVHRLDRDTSGVIICARNPETQSFLQRQFSDRKAKKKYTALLAQTPKEPEAVLRLPIERNPASPQVFRVGINGKPSETAYTILESYDNGMCLVELRPLTGRTHQLRVHMNYIGCPIVNDRLYGSQKVTGRLCLHAASLEITIPGGERHTFTAPIPDDMRDLIKLAS